MIYTYQRDIWIILSVFLALNFCSSVYSQVGIGNTDPKSTLDVSGAISLREGPALTLTNNNENIDLGLSIYSLYRITGPTDDFNILSFNTEDASANDGQLLTLINTTSFNMTLVHNDGSAGNEHRRIYCPSGTNLVLEGQNASVTLQYNAFLEKWVVNGSTDVGGYGKNIMSSLGASDIDIDSSDAADMDDMEITFTPKHETVFVNFSASGTMDKGGASDAQAFANFELTKYGVVVAGATTLASDRSYTEQATSSTTTPPGNCREMFYDSGGATGDYGYYEDRIWTFAPTNPGEKITVEFLAFEVENGWDGLMIYNGPNTSSPIISSGSSFNRTNCPNGAWTGTATFSALGSIFTSTHSTGALTFRFLSDVSLNYAGWEACVTSGDTPPPDPCREMFYDRGGVGSNYPANDNYTRSFSPTNPGEKVSVRFTSFDTEYAYDGLMIYDGPNASSPLISSGYTFGNSTCPDGAWSGTGSYSAAGKTFTSTAPGGELHFVFRSDYLFQYSGWTACVNSIIPIPLDCRELFYDSGGENGNYSNSENVTYNFSPTNIGEKVSVEFLSFNSEQGWDGLMVYNGPDTSFPLISSGSTYNYTNCPNGAWTGNEAFSAEGRIFTSSAPGGELTFVFRSDFSSTRSGWKACVNSVSVYSLDTAWNASFTMYPVVVTPGIETTIKIRWSRDSSGGRADVLRNNVSSDPARSHRSLTIFD